jgi:4-oxalocrotonate tautomerase family enzyme
MPFIQCHLAEGLSDERKRQLIRDIIVVTHDTIDDDPKLINIVLHEHPAVNLCVSGRISGEPDDKPGPPGSHTKRTSSRNAI